MLNFEHQLQQIEVEKQEIEKQRTELSVADTFLSEMIEKYTHLNNTLELKKHEILSAARQNAKQIIADANKKIEHTIAEIKTFGNPTKTTSLENSDFDIVEFFTQAVQVMSQIDRFIANMASNEQITDCIGKRSICHYRRNGPSQGL